MTEEHPPSPMREDILFTLGRLWVKPAMTVRGEFIPPFKSTLMDSSIFLEPVPQKCFSEPFRPGKNTLGETITIFRSEDEFPNLENVQLALLGVKEERGAVDNKGCADGVDLVRKALYQLFDHWPQLNIIDLGNVKVGKEINDTYFAFNQVLTELLKNKIVPIVI